MPEVRRQPLRLTGDPGRVIAPGFLPGHERFIEGEPYTSTVVERVLDLDEAQVRASLAWLLAEFAPRHSDLEAELDAHFESLARRRMGDLVVSRERRLLLGACFTREYTVESVALFNPSMALHPDQSGLAAGEARFVMTVRTIGDGLFSSIGFREGVVHADGSVTVSTPDPRAVTGEVTRDMLTQTMLANSLADSSGPTEAETFALGLLPTRFGAPELERALAELGAERLAHVGVDEAQMRLRDIASRHYTVTFGEGTTLTERVLWPQADAEDHGMEDARLVRCVDVDGTVVYRATYTAYDGFRVACQLLSTVDFRTFHITALTGEGAGNKGLALFPRPVGGRRVALSRFDRENNSITWADQQGRWGRPVVIQHPREPWEVIQLGNCGSPIETERGWLVLTHGVGPLRSYAIGAMLLDLDDPTRLIGRLREPLLVPSHEECGGVPPHIVYSCGSLLHDGLLVVPYGCSDSSVRVATVPVDEVLEGMTMGVAA